MDVNGAVEGAHLEAQDVQTGEEQGSKVRRRVMEKVRKRSGEVGGYLSGSDPQRRLREARQLVRRQPWVVAGVCAAVGLLAARMIKITSSRSEAPSKLSGVKETMKQKISEGTEAVARVVSEKKDQVVSKVSEKLPGSREEPGAPETGLRAEQASPEALTVEEVHPAEQALSLPEVQEAQEVQTEEDQAIIAETAEGLRDIADELRSTGRPDLAELAQGQAEQVEEVIEEGSEGQGNLEGPSNPAVTR